MGILTKQYLRYTNGPVFGIVGSGSFIHLITKSHQNGKFVLVPACERVLLWDLRRKVKILTLHCDDIQGIVTSIEPRPPQKGFIDNTHVAVGYSDGSVVLYDLIIGHSIKFNGHKGGVSTLSWDSQGMRLASASDDGEIVLWDMVTERGIIRLRGHKGRISKIRFLQTKNILISCGKDTYLKFWDLDTNICFYTMTLNNNKVCDFLIIKNDSRLLTGGDGNISIWNIKFLDWKKEEDKVNNSFAQEIYDVHKQEPLSKHPKIEEQDNCSSVEKQENNHYIEVKLLGYLARSQKHRICCLDTDGRTIAVQDKSNIDLYTILNEEQLRTQIKKRLNKYKKRGITTNSDEEGEIFVSDEVKKISSIKTLKKISSISVITLPDDTVKIASLQADNSISLLTSHVKENTTEDETTQTGVEYLYAAGHRTEIRSVAINLIGNQIITASADSIKVWDSKGLQSIKTIDCDYPLCLLLPPGDRHVLIGTKSGKLQLYDLASGVLLEDFVVHSGNKEDEERGIWALSLTHNGRGFVSGGSDCLVKFWNFELIEDTTAGKGKRLSIFQDTRALKVADQITSIACSSCGNYLAVATFDLKETVYYMDSLKLLHEFYGKSMPSTCLDFSTDSTMIISGCKDSCIRIFATDFGDQKRLLKNCHQGGVTEVKFIGNTHLFFSCGNDGTVKQWDADNFERVLTLNGHHGITRCLAISNKGSFVVTSGQDRAIRIWEKTNEPLILEDAKEEERKQQEELMGGSIPAPVISGEKDIDAVRPSKISKDTEKAADELLEALSIYQQQKESGKNSAPNQLMSLVYKTDDPLKFVLLVLRKVKGSELEESILILPFNLLLVLLVCLKGFLSREWDVELSTRVLIFVLRTNMPQLINYREASSIIRLLANMIPQKTQNFQDLVGFNYAGLSHMSHRVEKRNDNELFVEAALNVKDARKKRKKKERTAKRALLSL